jgi:hypothetical protein
MAGRVIQAVEHLPSKHEILNSNTRITKKRSKQINKQKPHINIIWFWEVDESSEPICL